MAATLRDVAQHAQVSLRTVSNVVSGYEHVSDQVRTRVRASMEELQYRPNPVARSLRSGRTGLLALVVPEIGVPYFAELASQLISAAADLGYRVMVDQTGHDHDRELELLTGADRRTLFDGVLFAPLVTAEQARQLRPRPTTPVLLLGEHDFAGDLDHVGVDNVAAARDATTHLVEAGRRRVAAIGAQPLESYATPRQRTAGYHRALELADLPAPPELLRPAAHYRRADGYLAMQALLALPEPPDAVFCYTDLLALGAVRAAFDAGRRVPDDVAVIGIDDIEEGRYARPSLSTVSLDLPFIASTAVRRLTARVEDPSADEPEQVIAPHTVLARESTGGPAPVAPPPPAPAGDGPRAGR